MLVPPGKPFQCVLPRAADPQVDAESADLHRQVASVRADASRNRLYMEQYQRLAALTSRSAVLPWALTEGVEPASSPTRAGPSAKSRSQAVSGPTAGLRSVPQPGVNAEESLGRRSGRGSGTARQADFGSAGDLSIEEVVEEEDRADGESDIHTDVVEEIGDETYPGE